MSGKKTEPAELNSSQPEDCKDEEVMPSLVKRYLELADQALRPTLEESEGIPDSDPQQADAGMPPLDSTAAA